MEMLLKQEQLRKNNQLIDTNKNLDEFEIIMQIYKNVLDNTIEKFINLQQLLNKYYNYDVITNVTGRLKSADSILRKNEKEKNKYDI